ncbi:MAG: helix-turn-helix domain-containing protein [Myxococcota bacterium]
MSLRHFSAVSDELLSSGEAAKILGVGASTIKRWADTGQIQCVKTLGKHRRFRRSEVEALAQKAFTARRSNGDSASSSSEGQTVAARFEGYINLLLGDYNAFDVHQVLVQQFRTLGSWYRVADEVGEVLAEIGDGWQQGRITVVQEHIATERLARAIMMCTESIRTSNDMPQALLLTAEHDDHTMGLSLLELTLREAGWRSHWAGRRTPISEARSHVANGKVELVCVSASILSADTQDLRRQTDELIAACKPFGVRLILGGRGAWPEPRYGYRLETFAEFRDLLSGAF